MKMEKELRWNRLALHIEDVYYKEVQPNQAPWFCLERSEAQYDPLNYSFKTKGLYRLRDTYLCYRSHIFT